MPFIWKVLFEQKSIQKGKLKNEDCCADIQFSKTVKPREWQEKF